MLCLLLWSSEEQIVCQIMLFTALRACVLSFLLSKGHFVYTTCIEFVYMAALDFVFYDSLCVNGV